MTATILVEVDFLYRLSKPLVLKTESCQLFIRFKLTSTMMKANLTFLATFVDPIANLLFT